MERKQRRSLLRWMPVGLIVLLCLIGIVHILLIRMEMNSVKKISLDAENIEDGMVSYDIERCEIANGELLIEGWRAVPTNERRAFGSYFVLEDEAGNFYQLPSSYVERPDVTGIVNDGNEYSRSGLVSRVKISKLQSGTYTLLIAYRPDSQSYMDFSIEDYYVITTDMEVVIP